MRDMAKNFAEKKIAPTMEEDEKEHKFRREIVKEMARLGFFGCIAPEKYGGTESGYLCGLSDDRRSCKGFSLLGPSLQSSDELHSICSSRLWDGGTAAALDSQIDQCGLAGMFCDHRAEHRF